MRTERSDVRAVPVSFEPPNQWTIFAIYERVEGMSPETQEGWSLYTMYPQRAYVERDAELAYRIARHHGRSERSTPMPALLPRFITDTEEEAFELGPELARELGMPFSSNRGDAA